MGLGFDFRPCSEGYDSVTFRIKLFNRSMSDLFWKFMYLFIERFPSSCFILMKQWRFYQILWPSQKTSTLCIYRKLYFKLRILFYRLKVCSTKVQPCQRSFDFRRTFWCPQLRFRQDNAYQMWDLFILSLVFFYFKSSCLQTGTMNLLNRFSMS